MVYKSNGVIHFFVKIFLKVYLQLKPFPEHTFEFRNPTQLHTICFKKTLKMDLKNLIGNILP